MVTRGFLQPLPPDVQSHLQPNVPPKAQLQTQDVTVHSIPKHETCRYCMHPNDNPWISLSKQWSLRFYCISLLDSEDRAQTAIKEFHRVGLCAVVTMFRPKRAKYFLFGCWDSHRRVAQLEYNNCCYNTHNNVRNSDNNVCTVVFEDDVCFDVNYDAQQLCNQIDIGLGAIVTERWYVLSLGTISWWSMPYAGNVLRNAGLCMHAYILSQRGMKWFIDHPPKPEPIYGVGKVKPKYNGIGIDTYMTTKIKSYCLSPMIAYQHQTIKSSHQQPLVETLFLTPSKMKATQWWIPLTWTLLITTLICGISSLSSFLVTKCCWDSLIWLGCTSGFALVFMLLWLCVISGAL